MTLAALLILTPLWAQTPASTASSDSLMDRAQTEVTTPIQTPASKKTAPADTVPRFADIMKLQDTYEAPRTRSFDWRFEVAAETLQLKGTQSSSALGTYDMQDAGEIPLFTVRTGILKDAGPKWRWGVHLYGGYGARQYNLITPTDVNLSPRLNISAYGLGAALRFLPIANVAADLVYEQGPFNVHQSSSETTFAQWSENGTSQALRLAGTYLFRSGWEAGAGYQERKLLSSRFEIASSHLLLSTGVRW